MSRLIWRTHVTLQRVSTSTANANQTIANLTWEHVRHNGIGLGRVPNQFPVSSLNQNVVDNEHHYHDKKRHGNNDNEELRSVRVINGVKSFPWIDVLQSLVRKKLEASTTKKAKVAVV